VSPTPAPDRGAAAPSASATHWDATYASRASDEVSWFQAEPEVSLRLVTMCLAARVGAPTGRPDTRPARIVDVGAGASLLVDHLLASTTAALTLVDASADILATVAHRLGAHEASRVRTIVTDVRDWRPDETFAVWHDRAAFHFLVDEEDRSTYARSAATHVAPGGHLIVATFAADGPQTCSGLPVHNYTGEALCAVFEPAFEPVHHEREEHRTPAGHLQPFTWVVLRRR